MNQKDIRLIESQKQNDPELMVLWQEHKSLKQKLKKLNNKSFLSVEDLNLKKSLQIHKLAGKTRIEQILSHFR